MKDIERPETIYAKMLIKSPLSLEYCVVLSYLSLKQNIYLVWCHLTLCEVSVFKRLTILCFYPVP